MVIKSSHEYQTIIAVLFGVVIAFFFCILYVSKNVLQAAISAGIIMLLVVRYWITIGRTLIMNKDGCRVQFLCFYRMYKWEELETIQVEDYTHSIGYKIPYKSGTVFSKKRSRKPAWLMPVEYCLICHPFSLFFVFFDPHIKYGKWDYQCPDIYVVEETEFRKNMENWNVKKTGDDSASWQT